MVSISITVLKALKDRAEAGHRKFPAASVQAQTDRGESVAVESDFLDYKSYVYMDDVSSI